jgi:hypothetical protein
MLKDGKKCNAAEEVPQNNIQKKKKKKQLLKVT